MATIRDEFDRAHVFAVPALRGGEPEVTIAVQPVGGGTPGKVYALNDWFYEVRVNRETVLEGSDLRSGAVGRTAEQMSAELADMIAYGDDPEMQRVRERIATGGDTSGVVDRLAMYRESILTEGE